jgi:tetratricopeptide (TPR) repeat protein
MTQQTNWLPGIIALAISLICGAAYLLIQRRKGGAPVSPEPQRDGVRDDLERRAQSLIEQLKELVADKHNLAPEQFAAEKARLEKEAATALRARDEYLQQRKLPATGASGAAAPAQAPAPTGFGARNPRLTGALWGAGIVLFFGALGYLLTSELRPREEGMEATGKVPGEGSSEPQGQASQEDQELTQAQERLKTNPNDLEASAMVAHEMIRRQNPEEAERLTVRSLAIDPFHVESRVHRGVLRAIRGDVPGAEKELETLADTYPGAQEALLFLGFIHIQAGNRAKALAYFERFSVEVPREMQPPQLEAAIGQLRQEAGPKP